METNKKSPILTFVLPITFSVVFLALVLQVALFVYRKNRAVGEGEIPAQYLAIYAYGNVREEGPFYFPSAKATIQEIAALSGMEFEDDYYTVHFINKLYKITYSDCVPLSGRHAYLLFFPAENLFPVYALNTVTKEELRFLGLSEDAANRVVSYREAVGVISRKSDLLTANILTVAEYELIFANLETLPQSLHSLKK